MKTTTRALGILAAAGALLALPGRGEAQSAEEMARVAEGATVYGQQCTRCHNARSPMERNDREWITIVAHMRARANLTRTQARAVAAFLKATNAPEFTPGGSGSGQGPVTGGTEDGGATSGASDARAPSAAASGESRIVLPTVGYWNALSPRQSGTVVRYILSMAGGGG